MFEMIQGGPEQILHEVALTIFVGMGESIAGRSDGSPDAAQPAAMIAQSITNVVEPNGVSELGIDQGDDMTPRSEGPGFFINAVLTG